MQCPKCGGDTKIARTMASQSSAMRERVCLKCGHRWQTIELSFDKVESVQVYGELMKD